MSKDKGVGPNSSLKKWVPPSFKYHPLLAHSSVFIKAAAKDPPFSATTTFTWSNLVPKEREKEKKKHKKQNGASHKKHFFGLPFHTFFHKSFFSSLILQKKKESEWREEKISFTKTKKTLFLFLSMH